MHRSVLRIASVALLAGVAAAPALFAQQQEGQRQKKRTPQGDGGGAQPTGPQAGRPQTLQVGENAPAMTLKDLEGNTHTLRDHRGEVVVLEWIDPTNRQWVQQHQQNGDLKRTYERYKEQGVTWMAVCSYRGHGVQGQPQQTPPAGMQEQVLPMNEQQAKQACERLIQDLGFDFPILLDTGGHAARQFKIAKIPYIVAIDQQNRVAFAGPFEQLAGVAQGGGGIQQFERVLDRAIRGEPSLPAGAPREPGQQGQQGQQNR